MRKKASKKIGKQNTGIIFKNSKSKDENIEEKLLDFSDEEIEKLFEMEKISQSDYEYILALKKKSKEKKKSNQEKFEERIRCNDTIIQKIIRLGRKFRKEELNAQKAKEEARLQALLAQTGTQKEPDVERDERIKSKEDRNISSRSRNRGRGREIDR